jgi:CheY-like chemotaxis protein
MTLRGKRILILESDYIVAYAIQRVLEGEGATAHVSPSVEAKGCDGVIVDWGWARRPLAKTLSEAGKPILCYTSDPTAIQRRLPGCRVLSKPATDQALLRAVIDLLHASE